MTHLKDLDPKVITELTDRDFTCRLVTDDQEDIVKALECIYSHYKFDYLHQALYDVDYFKEILQGGRYVAAVAENRDGQVMGFGALDAHPWFDGLMEMGGLVVNPIARGLGLGDMLDDYRVEIGRTRGIRGLFATPVMPNPASQKLLSRHGYIPTGMYFHAGGPESLGASGDGFHPMDCGFSVYIYDKETEHVLYAHEEIKDFVRDIFGEVGLKYRFAEAGAGCGAAACGTDGTAGAVANAGTDDSADTTSGTDDSAGTTAGTDLDLNHEVASKLLEVRIRNISPDFREKIDALPYFEEGSDTQALMLLLCMNEPMCPECYEYLRSRGFIFSGLVPGGEQDLIVMQHLRHPIYRDYLHIEPDYERVLNLLYEVNGADME